MFLQQTADTLTYVIYQNLFIEKICKIDLGYGQAICDMYEQSTNISGSDFLRPLMNQIQTRSSEFSMYNSLVENSFPVILVLFLGVWSDQKKRRKPTLILSLVGKLVRTLGLLLNAYFPSWPSWILLITAALPHSLGGANAVFQMSAFSYISDSTKSSSRTWRITVVEIFWYLGTPVGLSLGAYLFQVGGYLCVFGASFACHLIGVLYTIFVLPEVPSQELKSLNSGKHNTYGTDISSQEARISYESSGSVGSYCHNNNTNEKKPLLVNLQCDIKEKSHIEGDTNASESETDDETSTVYELVIGSVKSIVKSRPKYMRECLLAICAIWLLYFSSSHGESSMKYLFTRNKFSWREQQFSLWTIVEAAVGVIGLTAVMPLCNKILKLSDPLLGVIGAFSRISSRLCYALAPTSDYLYVGTVFDAGGVMTTLAARTLASKCVPRNERGRIFAFLGCIEALVPFFAVPMYSFIYTSTLKTVPSSIYYTSTGIYTIIFIIFGLIFIGLKMKIIGFSDSETNSPKLPDYPTGTSTTSSVESIPRQISSANSDPNKI
ncbi:unnamed protein product [Allacma fusca]|uniref:Proton-coupled folate transporter n=1 Tax=Allacma fusca TaxID=39272 RepID=A0A8J2L9R5_9HEXA|nr:unnamed protein product [Allacma fusca]